RFSTPEIESKTLAERVNLLFLHARGIHVMSVGVIVLLAALYREVAVALHVVTWAAAFVAIEIAQLLVAMYFHHSHIPAERAARWLRIFRIGSVPTALCWGAAGLALFPAHSVIHQVLLAVVLVGVAAIAVPLLA